MGDLLTDSRVYITGYIILTGLAFWLLQNGLKVTAQKRAELTRKEIKCAVKIATEETVKELETATGKLITATGTAVEDINDFTERAKTQLQNEIKRVDEATAKLKNIAENQEIFVVLEYSFKWSKPPDSYNMSLFYGAAEAALWYNNTYELTLKKNENKAVFADEINKDQFQIATNMIGNGFQTLIENANVNIYADDEGRWQYNSQSIRMGILLNVKRLDIQLSKLKKGDILNFSLLNRISKENAVENKIKGLSEANLLQPIHSLFTHSLSGNPVGSLKLTVRLNNGTFLKCETKEILLLSVNTSGYDYTGEIYEISKEF